MDYDDQRRLVIENVRAECIVHDVTHLLTQMLAERFPFDVYYANFEYVLYRAAQLFRPLAVSFHPDALDMGALFLCEVKLLGALASVEAEEQAEKALVFDAVEHYIAKYYVTNVTTHESEAIKRISLLMNAKHVLDQAAARSNRKQDYIVCYTKDLVVSLLYGLLLDEFIADLNLQRTLLMYEAEVEDAAASVLLCHHQESKRRVEQQLWVMERLRTVVEQQRVDEFAYAVEAFPAAVYEADRQAVYRRDRTAEYNRRLNRQYMMQRNPEPSVAQIETSATEIVITECPTGEHRYLRLANHQHHYIHVTRRFIFDCALKRAHGMDCALQWTAPTTTERALEENRLQYMRCCNVCRYFQCNETLGQFYMLCEEHRYNQATSSDAVDHEATLNRQLTHVLVELMGPLCGLQYRCLHTVMLLFRGAQFRMPVRDYCTVTSCHRERQSDTVELFEMLDLTRLTTDMMAGLDNELLVQEAELQLCACRGRPARLPQHHHAALASEIALLLRLVAAVAKQQVDVEKYERSLSSCALAVEAGSSVSVHRDVQTQLVTIYNLYTKILRDWLSIRPPQRRTTTT